MLSRFNHSASCIILFARAPVLGRVKTRLAKDLEHSVVLGLYQCFVRDILDKVMATGFSYKIFYEPAGSMDLMQHWLGPDHDFYAQRDGNLGLKMADAFQQVFKHGYQQAVLMGTDFPDLPGTVISDALLAFGNKDQADAVIGPTNDGGYYLIGCQSNTFLPEVFHGKAWGATDVFEKTMADFSAAGLRVEVLLRWRDVDDYEDLTDLMGALSKRPDHGPHTYRFMLDNGLI